VETNKFKLYVLIVKWWCQIQIIRVRMRFTGFAIRRSKDRADSLVTFQYRGFVIDILRRLRRINALKTEQFDIYTLWLVRIVIIKDV
jgi:hypothetical protein